MIRISERLRAMGPMLKHAYPPIEGPLAPPSVKSQAIEAAADLASAASELSKVADDLKRVDQSVMLPNVTDAIEEIAAILERAGHRDR